MKRSLILNPNPTVNKTQVNMFQELQDEDSLEEQEIVLPKRKKIKKTETENPFRYKIVSNVEYFHKQQEWDSQSQRQLSIDSHDDNALYYQRNYFKFEENVNAKEYFESFEDVIFFVQDREIEQQKKKRLQNSSGLKQNSKVDNFCENKGLSKSQIFTGKNYKPKKPQNKKKKKK